MPFWGDKALENIGTEYNAFLCHFISTGWHTTGWEKISMEYFTDHFFLLVILKLANPLPCANPWDVQELEAAALLCSERGGGEGGEEEKGREAYKNQNKLAHNILLLLLLLPTKPWHIAARTDTRVTRGSSSSRTNLRTT